MGQTTIEEAFQTNFELGTFEGFNLRRQAAIFPNVSASQLIAWDHEAQGEAEFWPAGDRAEVALLFSGHHTVSAPELAQLDGLLDELGGDSLENFLRIYFAVAICGESLEDLRAETLEESGLHIFLGSSFIDLRQEAALELFELYYPEEYRMWEQSKCDGLLFDEDIFLDSPSFLVDEVRLQENAALLVCPQ